MANSRIILANNTDMDLRMFDKVFIDCVKNGTPLPEELEDIIDFKIVIVDGLPRGIINYID